jgi:hypothetical protein
MHQVPPVLRDRAIHSLTLELVYDERRADYDWIYDFRLAADVEGLGTLFAAGECPWYARDKMYGPHADKITANTVDLGCYIDCDGGGFRLDRIARQPTLVLSFAPRLGLKMKGGCGGAGSYRIKPAHSEVAFRLARAGAEACRPLRQWAIR